MSKKRWTLMLVLVGLGLVCGLSTLRMRAANPTSTTISPASSPFEWQGTAVGAASADESTCVETGPAENINCDTFTITVSGTPASWAGKRIRVAISWVVLASDYDLYIHKGNNAGPIVDQSAGSATTSETGHIEPSDLDASGTTVFTAHIVYFAATAGDQYRGVASVVLSEGGPTPTPTPPSKSPNWNINYHGTCCEGNLAASGNNTYVLLPVLVNGNKIRRSTDGGKTWVETYPPAPASFPYGIEGDMQAFGNDVIFFGTELADAVVAHSDNQGDAGSWIVVQAPVASPGNDQAWSYLGPFGNLNPVPNPTDEPYVLAGWFRIGSILAFSFNGGLTFPIQTPLVGNNGSGPEHVICHSTATDPPASAPDSRVTNQLFARQKAGRHGAWGTEGDFYWSETVEGTLYVCRLPDLTAPTTWTGTKHPVSSGPGDTFVVTHSAFDNKGTLYVMHGNKLYVSFTQGKTFAFIHTLPRFGNARRSDAGADQFFVVDCGTIHIGLLEDAGEGNGNVFYLRGSGVNTATPTWTEELVDVVGNVRLDFMYIVLDGNGIPTISYTTPGLEVTTASRKFPVAVGCVAPTGAVSRKVHGGAGTFDINLPLIGNPGIECRTGGTNGQHQVVVTFALPVSITSASVTSGTGSVSSTTVSNNQVFVNLTGVTNEQTLAITLVGVNDGNGTGNVVIPMGVLLGDTTANRAVNSSDVSQTKSQSGQFVGAGNFRTDVSANGSINSTDTSLVKSKSGTALP